MNALFLHWFLFDDESDVWPVEQNSVDSHQNPARIWCSLFLSVSTDESCIWTLIYPVGTLLQFRLQSPIFRWWLSIPSTHPVVNFSSIAGFHATIAVRFSEGNLWFTTGKIKIHFFSFPRHPSSLLYFFLIDVEALGHGFRSFLRN